MKPFLGINLTTDKNNTQTNGDELIVARPSLAMSQTLEDATQTAINVIKKAGLPLPLRIVQWVCGAAALLIAAGILKSGSISEGYKNAPVLYWVAGACALVWGTLMIAGKVKAKKVTSADQNQYAISKFTGTVESVFYELGVPTEAKEIDLLSFYYKEKDGEIDICEKVMQLSNFFNKVYSVHKDSENLYFTNTEAKYAIPLSSVTGLKVIKKKARVNEWHKQEKYNEGSYKQFKLSADQFGCVHCHSYCILEANCNGTVWGVYFPSYEQPVIEELVGIKGVLQD